MDGWMDGWNCLWASSDECTRSSQSQALSGAHICCYSFCPLLVAALGNSDCNRGEEETRTRYSSSSSSSSSSSASPSFFLINPSFCPVGIGIVCKNWSLIWSSAKLVNPHSFVA